MLKIRIKIISLYIRPLKKYEDCGFYKNKQIEFMGEKLTDFPNYVLCPRNPLFKFSSITKSCKKEDNIHKSIA